MVELWTVADMEKRLGCAEGYIRKLVFERKVPFIKLGHRTLRFDPVAIEKWLSSKVTAAADEK